MVVADTDLMWIASIQHLDVIYGNSMRSIHWNHAYSLPDKYWYDKMSYSDDTQTFVQTASQQNILCAVSGTLSLLQVFDCQSTSGALPVKTHQSQQLLCNTFQWQSSILQLCIAAQCDLCV